MVRNTWNGYFTNTARSFRVSNWIVRGLFLQSLFTFENLGEYEGDES